MSNNQIAVIFLVFLVLLPLFYGLVCLLEHMSSEENKPEGEDQMPEKPTNTPGRTLDVSPSVACILIVAIVCGTLFITIAAFRLSSVLEAKIYVDNGWRKEIGYDSEYWVKPKFGE